MLRFQDTPAVILPVQKPHNGINVGSTSAIVALIFHDGILTHHSPGVVHHLSLPVLGLHPHLILRLQPSRSECHLFSGAHSSGPPLLTPDLLSPEVEPLGLYRNRGLGAQAPLPPFFFHPLGWPTPPERGPANPNQNFNLVPPCSTPYPTGRPRRYRRDQNRSQDRFWPCSLFHKQVGGQTKNQP